MTSEPMTTHSPLVIVGDDGSADADVAWLWVISHAWTGWHADIITATEPAFPPPSWDEPAELVEWDPPHPREAPDDAGFASTRSLTTSRDPRLAIGTRSDADLLVIGPGKLDEARSLVLGSTTDWILHEPACPTVVVRSASSTTNVVVCADGSAHAATALAAFVSLPWASDATVTVLSVDDGQTDTTAAAKDAQDVLTAAGIESTVVTAEGKPTREILEYVEGHAVDLLVLGTRGLSGWERIRLGSSAGHLVRAAVCNTLVAMARD